MDKSLDLKFDHVAFSEATNIKLVVTSATTITLHLWKYECSPAVSKISKQFPLLLLCVNIWL